MINAVPGRFHIRTGGRSHHLQSAYVYDRDFTFRVSETAGNAHVTLAQPFTLDGGRHTDQQQIAGPVRSLPVVLMCQEEAVGLGQPSVERLDPIANLISQTVHFRQQPVELVIERAFIWRPHAPVALVAALQLLLFGCRNGGYYCGIPIGAGSGTAVHRQKRTAAAKAAGS
uniref:Uncharacterized protein n=1 Tax=Anopheles melas TaxID=34690 RepID=A0A182U478_9DIPT